LSSIDFAKLVGSGGDSVASAMAARAAIERGVAPEPVVEQPAQPTQSKQQKPAGPVDVIKLARQRLKEVRSELKRMKKLQAEEQRLTRLLAAADGKQLATVRDISRRVG
jgi:hypothetical protein